MNSGAVLEAMEPCEEGSNPLYLPYKLDKEGQRVGDLATAEELSILGKFIFRKLAELGDQLYSGDISPNPYEIDGASFCKWCCYGDVCREQKEIRQLEKLKNRDEFWAKLREEVEEHA